MKIACCSTLNDFYFEGFKVFLYSLLKHNPDFNYDYYVYSWGELSTTNKEQIKAIYSKVIFKDIDNSIYEGSKSISRWRSWNINCINRFEIFDLTDYEKIIFFDADMLVLGDLTYLFNIDVDFGGVEIVKGAEMDHPGRYDKNIRSFNGGLLVISKRFLNTETKNALIKIGLMKPWTGDEPILNTFFTNDVVTFLPKEYNVQTPELTESLLATAKIIHFLSVKKPWTCEGGYSNRYDDFVIKSINNMTLLLKLDAVYRKYSNEAKKYYGT